MARRSQAKLYNSKRMSISFESNLRKKLEVIGDRIIDEACRPAAYAAVTVLYDEMRIRVPVGEGLLKSAIYRWRDKSETNVENIGQSVFYVGVNKRKAPHWWWIENGHYQYKYVAKNEQGEYYTTKDKRPQPKYIPAKPYLRPSIDAKMGEALKAGYKELQVRINKILTSSNATITDFN